MTKIMRIMHEKWTKMTPNWRQRTAVLASRS
jgi:hypothetical protein